QCALNPDGTLKDASEINFLYDPDDATPIASGKITNDETSGKRNPIYLFYEEVKVNENGEVGEEGDKHYKCYHGNRKTFTISKRMNYSLNGFTFKPTYQLYLVLYSRSRNGVQPSPEEVLYASGKMSFDASVHNQYIKTLDAQAAGIKEAFARQQAKAAEPWDQDKFERLLTEWVAACDQPFEEVEKPEFIAMMEYGRDPTKFSLPKREGIRRRISISLDAWTSSNYYAFLAIVAHYVTDNRYCGKIRDISW
ncbi:hypothetical protein B0H34DRAFT_664204, partial [Crassisporium funariophilum]